MTAAAISEMQAENAMLKAKVSAICKAYKVLKPVLQALKFFSRIKRGWKIIIEAAIAALDSACEVKSTT